MYEKSFFGEPWTRTDRITMLLTFNKAGMDSVAELRKVEAGEVVKVAFVSFRKCPETQS